MDGAPAPNSPQRNSRHAGRGNCWLPFVCCWRQKESLIILPRTLPGRGRVVTVGDGERGLPADLSAHWRRTLRQKGIVKGNEPLTRCGVGGVQRKGGGIRNTPPHLWPSGASPAVMQSAKAIKPIPPAHNLHRKHKVTEYRPPLFNPLSKTSKLFSKKC